MVWAGADLDALGLDGAIVAPHSRLAMAGLTQAMDDNLCRCASYPNIIEAIKDVAASPEKPGS